MGTSPINPAPDANPAAPTWIELSAFIAAQNEASRSLINYWFTLASCVLGALVLAISIGLGLFGWKTLADVTHTAEQVASSKAIEVASVKAKEVAEEKAPQAAQDAAKIAATEQVKLIMQDPHVQKLARDTASQLFREGAYKKTLDQAVHDQMQTALAEGVVGDYVVTVNGVPNQSIGITKRLATKKQ